MIGFLVGKSGEDIDGNVFLLYLLAVGDTRVCADDLCLHSLWRRRSQSPLAVSFLGLLTETMVGD